MHIKLMVKRKTDFNDSGLHPQQVKHLKFKQPDSRSIWHFYTCPLQLDIELSVKNPNFLFTIEASLEEKYLKTILNVVNFIMLTS